jgi:hypothetical protein
MSDSEIISFSQWLLLCQATRLYSVWTNFSLELCNYTISQIVLIFYFKDKIYCYLMTKCYINFI